MNRRGPFAALLAFTLISFVPTLAFAHHDEIVAFCKNKIGVQVGSGECAHLATESLRVAGAEFLRSGMPDSPASGDYVWGSLVKAMGRSSDGKVYDNNKTNKCRVGDIIQYRLGTSTKSHHTSIVAKVNTAGYPTEIYQQNFNSKRYVTKDSTDLQQLLAARGGYLRIYRATSPSNTNRTEFTIVNNAQTTTLSYTLNGSSKSIGGKNTSSGFLSAWSTASPPKISVGGQTYSISHRRGYEFYKSNGATKLRALSP